MKIYTRTGDDGTTGLFGGQRVAKFDLRLECYGTLDELNAAIGLAACAASAELQEMLRRVQNELFSIGSHLATPENSPSARALPELDSAMIQRLEQEIDAADAQMPQLRQFILPGGSEAGARLHLARTICRRAERRIVEFGQGNAVSPVILVYLNRLSDWLFVVARWANFRAAVADWPWER